MTPTRRTAVIVGMLFLICSAAAIMGGYLSNPLLAGSGYPARLSGQDARAVTGAILEFVWAVSGAGIAIGLYPVIRRWGRSLALAAVCFRVAEGILVLIAALSVLCLVTLSRQFVAAESAPGTSLLLGTRALLVTARGWIVDVLALVAFSSGAMMYYFLLFRSNLVPRWISGWGGLATALTLGVTLYTAYNRPFSETTMHTILNLPIGINEIVLAAWLIVKGFRRRQPEDEMRPTAAGVV